MGGERIAGGTGGAPVDRAAARGSVLVVDDEPTITDVVSRYRASSGSR
jgi:hypothetical protein